MTAEEGSADPVEFEMDILDTVCGSECIVGNPVYLHRLFAYVSWSESDGA
jgi:hypothetical protein